VALTTEILHSRYARGRLLGSGGMGEVFEGYDRLLTREVALKVLRGVYAADPAFLKRFEREAQAAAALAHPNIVGVYDFGVHGDSPFIVMEYVRGQTLRDLLDAEGYLAPDRAIRMAAQMCDALGVAHDRGIVHRDVKPSNIMITAEDSVKVMDFGIAQAGGLDKLTTPTAVLGTAKYISPEHAARLDVDARSDLYSLGVCLYEMLTGRAPFQDLLPVAIVYCHVNEPPRPPRELNPEIPEALEAVVLRALAKRPDDRYQSAEDLAEDLERVAHGWPLAAPTVATSIAAMLAGPDQAATPQAGGRAAGHARRAGGEAGTGASPPGAAGGTRAARTPGAGRRLSRRRDAGSPGWLGGAHAAGKPGHAARPGPKSRAAAGAGTVRLRPDVWAAQPAAPGRAAPVGANGARRWHLLLAAIIATALIAAIPFSLNRTPPQRTVPQVVGLPLPDALTWLSGAGLTNVDVQPMSDRTRRDLKVVSQAPGPGSRIDKNHLIVLEVVPPGTEVVVPGVRGKTIADATEALEAAGLVVLDEYQWTTDPSIEDFRVIGTKPGAGTRRRAGQAIRLVVSSGPGDGAEDGAASASLIGRAPTTIPPQGAGGGADPATGTPTGMPGVPGVPGAPPSSETTPGSTPGQTTPPKTTGIGGDGEGPAPATVTSTGDPTSTTTPPSPTSDGGILKLLTNLLR
jgi:eukaryotic-like serine/threonine-protein kinase